MSQEQTRFLSARGTYHATPVSMRDGSVRPDGTGRARLDTDAARPRTTWPIGRYADRTRIRTEGAKTQQRSAQEGGGIVGENAREDAIRLYPPGGGARQEVPG